MSQITREEMQRIQNELQKPFPDDEVGLKPQAFNQSRDKALAIKYIDSRSVANRLDEVFGFLNWWDEYEERDSGIVICHLTVRFGDQVVTKVDVGNQSDQADGGDRMKAAYSDALKRAAVKFGIGRYLYAEDGEWLPWDNQKKRFVLPQQQQRPQQQQYQQPQKPSVPAPVAAPTVTPPSTSKTYPKLIPGVTFPKEKMDALTRFYEVVGKGKEEEAISWFSTKTGRPSPEHATVDEIIAATKQIEENRKKKSTVAS